MVINEIEDAGKNILGYEPINKLLKMFAGPAIISMLASSLIILLIKFLLGTQ